ncbi:hypothetical protein BH23ACT2_BH23ACT2_20890 [soil metagenome]
MALRIWLSSPTRQVTASAASSGRSEKAPTPRLNPPMVTRDGMSGSTVGNRAQAICSATSGALPLAEGHTKL